MNRKVIFLDIDGVLNSERNYIAFGSYPYPNEPDMVHGEPNPAAESNLDRVAIGMIRVLAKETKAVIVLNSMWRTVVDAVEFGKKYNLPIIDKTIPAIRKDEAIKWWLRDNPDVRQYVIIDDDYMDDRDHQVQPDPTYGLSIRDFRRALDILNPEE